MSRRFERAGILSSRADPLVCACGAALAVVGLLIVALSLALPGALAGVLSSASIATPVGAVSLVALGVCLAMRGVRERPSILTWAIEALALVVVAACGAQVLGIALSPQVSAAWELARSPDSASFTSVLLRADLWLLVGSALVLLSLAPEGLAETATRACSLLVVATVAFLLTMVGALYASEGSDGGTVMVAVIIGLVAHICAVGVLRVREDEPSFVTRVATLLPLAPVVAIGVILGTWTWAPQDPVSPPIAVGAALLLYLGGVVAFAATRLARSARSASAAGGRLFDGSFAMSRV